MNRTTGSRSFTWSNRRAAPALKGGLLAAALALATALALPAGAQTQQAAPVPAQGITVIGYGKSTAPAETAEIQMVASQEEFGPPRAPDPDATPGAQEREAVGPMVEGLQAAGVPEEAIAVVVGTVGRAARVSPESTSWSTCRRRSGSPS